MDSASDGVKMKKKKKNATLLSSIISVTWHLGIIDSKIHRS